MRIVGDKHLKLCLSRASPSPALAGAGGGVEAIAFGYLGGPVEDTRLQVGATLSVAYRLEINEYRGTERLQLNCQHLVRMEC
jgi:hypothetical protein